MENKTVLEQYQEAYEESGFAFFEEPHQVTKVGNTFLLIYEDDSQGDGHYLVTFFRKGDFCAHPLFEGNVRVCEEFFVRHIGTMI